MMATAMITAPAPPNIIGITTNEQTKSAQRQQGQRLRRGEHVLDEFAEPETARVQDRQEHDHQDREQLLRRNADRIVPRQNDRWNNPMRWRNGRREHAE